MFDKALHPLAQRLSDKIAPYLIKSGAKANHITWASFLFGLLCLPAFAVEQYGLALIFILINRAGDGLDGAVARLEGAGPQGAFLDITLDFIFYSAVPLGFALANPSANALPAAFLLFSFMATAASFLALAATAAGKGIQNPQFPKKGIYYLDGITEGAETIGLFIVICLWPSLFPAACVIFGTLCLITAALRIHWSGKILP